MEPRIGLSDLTDPLTHRVYHASRRKRWRGLIMVAAALFAGGYLVWRDPYITTRDMDQVVALGVIWAMLFAIAAMGIERFFEPVATLAAGPEGLILFPNRRRSKPIPWADITRIEVFRFVPKKLSRGFLAIVVEDPRVISRHLPVHLKLAYRIDRWAAGENRYFRPPSDFDRPVDAVVEELEAMRRAHA